MTHPANLTSGRLLARNTLLNLAGTVAPFLVALVALPIIIRAIGVDRYGVFTLSMMAVGYLGLFDLGLGQALIKFISETAATNEQERIPGLFWSSLCLSLAFGAAAGAVVAVVAPWLAQRVLKVPTAFQLEITDAFYVLALAMPFVISSSSLNGTLAAFQRFDLINWVRIPTNAFSYIGLLLVLPFSHRLTWLVAVMALARLSGWFATLQLCFHVVPTLRHDLRPSRATIRPLMSFGGWVTVSNIVGPIMVYFDRFLIGAMLSMAAVTYYAVPYDVVSRLGVVPAAMTGVVFAAFSATFKQDAARATLIFERATRYTLLVVFVPVLLLVALAPEGLTLWLGQPFAAHSVGALRWLAVGLFINSFAWTPYGLLVAAHRPDLTAKFHLAEAPAYVALLWWILPRYGIAGAAFAWTARVAVDLVLLLYMARRLLPTTAATIALVGRMAPLGLVVLALSLLPTGLVAKSVFLSAALAFFALLAWTTLLDDVEKAIVRSYLRGSDIATVGSD